jgi:hypothetical protein
MQIKQKLISVFILSLIILFSSCNKTDESNPVTPPTNKFVGKWKTETPILVKVKTDFCTGTLEDVATMEWDLYWAVSATEDPNVMDIKMNYSSRNYTVTNPECNTGTGYVPEPQPMYLIGYVTDNTLSVEYLSEEIFYVNYEESGNIKVLRGDLSYSYCLVYCQEIYTDGNGLSITYY